MVAPSAAWVKLMGTSQMTSVSSRMKIGCSCTCTTTYRSPGGPPRSPDSPSPVSLSRVPVSTPGGTFTVSTLSVSTLPAPRQVMHGSVMTLPVPWHWPQVREIWKNPCVIRSSPAPWQVGQDFVRLGGLLELLLGDLVAGILVRMVLDGELAERALQFLSSCGSGDPEDLVVVTLLRHLHSSDRPPSARRATSNVRTMGFLSILRIKRGARRAPGDCLPKWVKL